MQLEDMNGRTELRPCVLLSPVLRPEDRDDVQTPKTEHRSQVCEAAVPLDHLHHWRRDGDAELCVGLEFHFQMLKHWRHEVDATA